MGSQIEIERKFLVSPDAILFPSTIKKIKQGYLTKNEKGSVRIRIVEKKFYGGDTPIMFEKEAYLMSKLKVVDDISTNLESSNDISLEFAEHLLNNFCNKIIEKTRYVVPFKGRIWEIDQFKSPNEGLLLGEIELENINDELELPPWVLEEVTGRPEYYNANM